jgi:hypothetical protein
MREVKPKERFFPLRIIGTVLSRQRAGARGTPPAGGCPRSCKLGCALVETVSKKNLLSVGVRTGRAETRASQTDS